MHIASVTLYGFRCFGTDQPTRIDLNDEITALIGTNGTGKTALLQALLRLFGPTQPDRRVRPQDFYVKPEEELEDEQERTLWIEVTIEFPELTESEATTVAPFFKKMIIREEECPFIRGRLRATWIRDNTLEGSIEEESFWILSSEDRIDEVDDHEKPKMSAYDRSLIRVEYIPVQRDAVSLIRRKTGTVVSQLIRAIQWSDSTRAEIKEASAKIREVVSDEEAIRRINRQLKAEWGVLHDGDYNRNPTLHIIEERFRELVRNVDISFQPTETGIPHRADELSDGLKSLFHLSLLISYHALLVNLESHNGEAEEPPAEDEQALLAEVPTSGEVVTNGDASSDAHADTVVENQEPFHQDRLQIPSLTIFALEEPENHLAPYYLSRIVGQLRDLSGSTRVQTLLTSHSPSTLGRIYPEEVRHLRLEGIGRTTSVRRVRIPSAAASKLAEKDVKYIREAIHAFPELYFARFVVFGEGDSEEIVLPRLARAFGYDFDPAFVAVVPLGGRHVNHFWRLVNDLGIPHATLLDLDLGRRGAGWRRVKYALQELLKMETDQPVLERPDGVTISEDDLETLGDQPLESGEELRNWLEYLERFGVFFSRPLDLDWAMMTAFSETYRASAAGRPRSTTESAMSNILGESCEARYQEAVDAGFYAESTQEEEYFSWYRYLFNTKSKPTTHLRALAAIDSPQQLRDEAPAVLRRLVDYVNERLGNQPF